MLAAIEWTSVKQDRALYFKTSHGWDHCTTRCREKDLEGCASGLSAKLRTPRTTHAWEGDCDIENGTTTDDEQVGRHAVSVPCFQARICARANTLRTRPPMNPRSTAPHQHSAAATVPIDIVSGVVRLKYLSRQELP